MALGLATVLSLSVLPSLAQAEPDPAQEPSPEPSAVATDLPALTPSGRPDLYLDMPYHIGGFEPAIVMTRGDEHWAGLAEDSLTRLQLEGLLETVGADVGDMVSGYALVSQEDLFAFVVGLRIDGVEPGSVAPAYMPLLIGNLVDPTTSEAELGGKEVTVISSLGEGDDYVELYVYDEGDTIWMVQAPQDLAESTMADLPAPLEGQDAG